MTQCLLAQATDPASVGSVLDFIQKGGIMMIPIGICSLFVVAVVSERLMVLRRARVIPRSFERGLESWPAPVAPLGRTRSITARRTRAPRRA